MMKIHERRYTKMLRSSTREAWRPPRRARGVMRAATRGGRRSLTALGSVILTDTSHHQPAGKGPPTREITDDGAGAQVGGVLAIGPRHEAQREVAAEGDAVVERRGVGDGLQPQGQLRDREERA